MVLAPRARIATHSLLQSIKGHNDPFKPGVERHIQTEIKAIVGGKPFD